MKIDLEQLWSQSQTVLTEFGINLIAALAIFVIGRWVVKAITNGITRLMKRNDVDPTLQTFIGNLLYAILLIVVILAAIGKLGVQTASLIAVLGAAGLAIGLALQGSLANFAAGVLIIFFRPYRVGDYIEAAGVAGSVEQLQIFTTILRTPDNKRVIVPNSKITDGVITNYSANDTRRLDLVIGVSYSDDLDKVRSVLESVLAEDERVLEEPAPVIEVGELGDSSVNFYVRPWVKTPDYWPLAFALRKTIKQRFDAEDISIPFPQRDLHVYRMPAENSGD